MLTYFKNIKDIYINKTMLILLALGFSSGFPYLLVFGTLTLWLKQAGISLAFIGGFSLVKIPYSVKWLWSPLIDNLKMPYLHRLGRRRSWAMVIQVCLFFSILAMSVVNPAQNSSLMAFLAFITAFLSASQDIVLDAYRVECFEKRIAPNIFWLFLLDCRRCLD